MQGSEDWKTDQPSSGVKLKGPISESFCLMDMSGRIHKCDASMVSMTGLSSDEICSRHCWEIMHGTHHRPVFCPVHKMVRAGKQATADVNLDGVHVNVEVTPMLNGNSNERFFVHRVSCPEQQKQPEAAQPGNGVPESTRTAVRTAAQRLNGLLAAINGHAQLALMNGECGGQVKRSLEQIRSAGLSATKVTKEMLAPLAGNSPGK